MQTDAASTLNARRRRSRTAALSARLGRFPIAIVQCMFRFAIAGVFLKAGLDKVASWELTVQLFTDEYKVPVLAPEIAARMAATFGIGCSLLLVADLARRGWRPCRCSE